MRTATGRILYRQIRTKINSSVNKSISKRTITNDSRLSTTFQTTRTAVMVEASSLRYAGYIMTGTEESMVRGWDDLDEEDDGTLLNVGQGFNMDIEIQRLILVHEYPP